MAGRGKSKVTFTFDDVKAAVESRKTEQSALNTLGKVLSAIGWNGKFEVHEGSDGQGKVRVYAFHRVAGVRVLLLIAGPGLLPRLEIAAREVPKGVYIESGPGPEKRVAKVAGSLKTGKRATRAVSAAVREVVAEAIEAEAVLHEEPSPGAFYPRAPKHRHAAGKSRGPAYSRAPLPGRRHSMSAWKAAHAPPPPPPPPAAASSEKAAKLAKLAALLGG